MDLELVTVGTELLLGFTVDTNSAFIGQTLAAHGLRVVRRTSVPDDPAAVHAAVREALARTRLVLTTGGLGPTRDDLTKHAIAGLFGTPLEFHQDIWDELVRRWARMGRTLAEKNRCQAEVPRGAEVLPNRWGTAPGLWLRGEPGEVIVLPGVPTEMKGLLVHEVLPRLQARLGGRVVRSLTIRTTGIPESVLAERVEDLEDALPPLTLAYLPGLEGVDLRLTAWDSDPATADRLLAGAAARFTSRLGENAYGTGDVDLARVLLDACVARKLTVATAESCTGGMIGERITSVPGASAAYLGGVVAYADRLKILFGVDPRILEAHGAVSGETVKALAEAGRQASGADLVVAVSGIAGPDGGTEEKPVGTVWFGFADRTGSEAQKMVFLGGRHDVRVRASQFALHGLLRRALSA